MLGIMVGLQLECAIIIACNKSYFTEKEAKEMNYGYAAGALAYIIWGLLPIFWKLLAQLSPLYILSARIVYSFFFCIVLVLLKKNWPQIKVELKQPKRMLRIAFASALVTLNWGVYIWAVNSGHIVDSSMGYYLNPLIVILFSTCFFKEKMTLWEWVAIMLAALGVLIMILRFGTVPWIALTLAISFASYGAVKKTLQLDGLTSLTLETTCMFPVFFVLMLCMEGQGQGAMPYGWGIFLLSMASGVVTAIPLLLYGTAVKTIPFSTVGFFQYIAPTISLALGIVFYDEIFTVEDFMVFIFIWLGLAVYLCSSLYQVWAAHRRKEKNILNSH